MPNTESQCQYRRQTKESASPDACNLTFIGIYLTDTCLVNVWLIEVSASANTSKRLYVHKRVLGQVQTATSSRPASESKCLAFDSNGGSNCEGPCEQGGEKNRKHGDTHKGKNSCENIRKFFRTSVQHALARCRCMLSAARRLPSSYSLREVVICGMKSSCNTSPHGLQLNLKLHLFCSNRGLSAVEDAVDSPKWVLRLKEARTSDAPEPRQPWLARRKTIDCSACQMTRLFSGTRNTVEAAKRVKYQLRRCTFPYSILKQLLYVSEFALRPASQRLRNNIARAMRLAYSELHSKGERPI